METERNMVVARGWGKGNCCLKGVGFQLCKMSRHRCPIMYIGLTLLYYTLKTVKMVNFLLPAFIYNFKNSGWQFLLLSRDGVQCMTLECSGLPLPGPGLSLLPFSYPPKRRQPCILGFFPEESEGRGEVSKATRGLRDEGWSCFSRVSGERRKRKERNWYGKIRASASLSRVFAWMRKKGHSRWMKPPCSVAGTFVWRYRAPSSHQSHL